MFATVERDWIQAERCSILLATATASRRTEEMDRPEIQDLQHSLWPTEAEGLGRSHELADFEIDVDRLCKSECVRSKVSRWTWMRLQSRSVRQGQAAPWQ